MKVVPLDQKWMDANVSKDMQNFAIRMREFGDNGYVHIPEGAPVNQTECLPPIPDAPKIQFKQIVSGENTDRSCVLKGAASCLWHLGYKRIANLLCVNLEKGNNRESGFELFQRHTYHSNLEKKERQEF